MNKQGESQRSSVTPLWRLAFRAGFLLAGTFAVLAMARWAWWLTSPESWSSELSPRWWHAHEMIFGFAMPVVAGFLLSAVATWTGLPGTSGTRLKLLFAPWLAGRMLLWLAPDYLTAAWLCDMAFVLLLMWELSRRVWARRQWRNMLFPPVLLALALFDSASFARADSADAALRLHYGAIWMIVVLVTIVGGRIIPLFTANALKLTIQPLPATHHYLCIGLTALTGVAAAFWPSTVGVLPLQGLYLLVTVFHLARLARWQGWHTGAVPLLWSMHVSYLCIPLALLGLAASAGNAAAETNMMHLLAVGGMGGMILSMMSRVSLGHTGRPLQVPAYLAAAFGMLFIAALTRAFLPLVAPAATPWAWRISAILWIITFALFLLRYTPILTRPRADGKPG